MRSRNRDPDRRLPVRFIAHRTDKCWRAFPGRQQDSATTLRSVPELNQRERRRYLVEVRVDTAGEDPSGPVEAVRRLLGRLSAVQQAGTLLLAMPAVASGTGEHGPEVVLRWEVRAVDESHAQAQVGGAFEMLAGLVGLAPDRARYAVSAAD